MEIISMCFHIFVTLMHIHSSYAQPYSGATEPPLEQKVPPMNRPSYKTTQPYHNMRPDNRGPVQPAIEAPNSSNPCGSNPCQNGGVCVETNNETNPFVCECRPLHLGDLCDVTIKSPEKVKLDKKGSNYLKVSWAPPDVDKPIFGYIVQHNEFGISRVNRSEMIHPNTHQYTIVGLQGDTQYVVCINILFNNTTIHNAVLREQCLEVKTLPSSDNSLFLIAIVCGAVFAVFLLLFILVVCCTRKRPESKEQQVSGAFTSMSWRRPREDVDGGYQDQSYLTERDIDNSVQFTDEMFLRSDYTQNQTNNASRNSYNDEAFNKGSPPKPVYMNHRQFAIRSSSVSGSPAWGSPEDQRDRGQSTTLATFNTRHKRTSSVPHANFRELPPSISNHMMRSPTTRDKDATGEFDVGGSYFIRRS